MSEQKPATPSLAIIGGTGYAGGHIAADAAARGLRVTAVSRSVPTTTLPDVEYVRGDLGDSAFLGKLATDPDVVVLAVHGTDPEGSALAERMPTVADAVRDLARLGVVGGAGSLTVSEDGPRVVDTPAFPEAFKPEALAHADVLTWLQTNGGGLDWFYVSPALGFGSYAPGEATGTYRVGGDVAVFDADGKSEISGADYAKAFVDEIVTPAHRGQRFTVAY